HDARAHAADQPARTARRAAPRTGRVRARRGRKHRDRRRRAGAAAAGLPGRPQGDRRAAGRAASAGGEGRTHAAQAGQEHPRRRAVPATLQKEEKTMSFIGINVLEVDGTGAPVLAAAPTSIAGFNILTRRGTPNRAVMVDSYARFVERFGGYFAGGLGAYLVKGFFDNGGQVAYVNRVVSDDPATGHAPAELSLDDATPAPTLRVAAGFRGIEDPGTWGNTLQLRVEPTTPSATRLRESAPASATGSVALAAPVDMTALPG